MKKHKYIVVCILISFLTVVGFISFDIYKRNTSQMELDNLRVLVNIDNYLLEENEDHVLIAEFTNTGDYVINEKPSFVGFGEKMFWYLDDDCLAVVKEKLDIFKISVFSSDGQLINEFDLQTVPDQLLSCNGGILLKIQDKLYFWNYNSNDDLVQIEAENFTKDSQLQTYESRYAYADKSYVYICDLKSNESFKIRSKSTFRGFLDIDTVLFTKNLWGGYIGLYKQKIAKKQIFNFRIIEIPAYISYSAISPDGNYLMILSPNDSHMMNMYIYDLKTFAHQKFDYFPVDYIKSVQWIE